MKPKDEMENKFPNNRILSRKRQLKQKALFRQLRIFAYGFTSGHQLCKFIIYLTSFRYIHFTILCMNLKAEIITVSYKFSF